MTTFLTILFVLLAINVLLLIFSVNGAKESIKRPLQRIFEGVILKLLYTVWLLVSCLGLL